MRRRPGLPAALGALAAALLALGAPSARADFGLLPGAAGFSAAALEADGEPATLAGAHPYALRVQLGFSPDPALEAEPGAPFSEGDLKDLEIELPPGLLENPTAVPTCSELDFHTPRSSSYGPTRSGESCPGESQIGLIGIHSGTTTRYFGLFNLTPPPGHPSRFGASPFGAPLVFTPRVRQGGGEYGLTLSSSNFSQLFDLSGLELEVWGLPWDSAHDGQRGDCLNESTPGSPPAQCPISLAGQSHSAWPYLTLPSECSQPPLFAVTADSWQQPGARLPSGEPDLSSPGWRHAQTAAESLTGCDQLAFFSTATVALSSAAVSSPTGLSFRLSTNLAALRVPSGRLASRMKRATIALPAGLTVNPAVASGLDACSEAQYAAEGVGTAPGAGCPNPSKIGTLRLETPLWGDEIGGSIFLARPYQNPFGTELAVYLVARSAARGILVKVAGELRADPQSGQLTASFDRLPQLPYTNLVAEFREGQRAALVSPPACGVYSTQVEMSPWSDPGAVLGQSSSLSISSGIGGGGCPGGSAPFAPGATAGALNGNSGAATDFYLHLTRRDGEQEITSYSAVLPRGVTGRIAGIPYCPDAAIEAAKSKSGRAEEAQPSCPSGSQIGRTFVGYGVGLAPAYAPGRMYLAGPYRGSALSVVAIDSAAVGPFDLGVIVIRSALRIDPLTAQLSIDSTASDRIPHILGGIPLRLRDIRIHIDRPGFTINPTSCEPASVVSILTGSGARFSDPSDDGTASATNLFQVSNCSARGFAPRLSLGLSGPTRRARYPSLRAVLVPRPGDANLRRVVVTLPHTEFLAQNHIREVCTRARFDAERCPPESVYGTATAQTPLLDGALTGPVYLRSSQNPMPDLVVDLRQGPMRIVLGGQLDSVDHGRIRASFDDLPDAPLTRFVLTMRGGSRSLLVNSANLCAARAPAAASLVAQNNKAEQAAPALRTRCQRAGKGGKRSRRGGR